MRNADALTVTVNRGTLSRHTLQRQLQHSKVHKSRRQPETQLGMIKQRAKQELPGRLAAPVAQERMRSKFNCTVSEVTVMNLQPEKNPILILPDGKKRSEPRAPSFHPPPPSTVEIKSSKGETKLWAEKLTKEGSTSPSLLHAGDASSLENLPLKRPVKLAPLEIPLEVKEAQLQKIMSIQAEAQLAAQKLASVGSINSEPHVKRVKNLAQMELENLHKIKLSEKATLEYRDGPLSSKGTKALCEVQIILSTEASSQMDKKSAIKDAPVTFCTSLIPKAKCNSLQAPGLHEDTKVPDGHSPNPDTARRRFRLRQMKEQQEELNKAKPLKATRLSTEEVKQQTACQRTQKTLSDASKLLENMAKKHRGRGAGQDEADEVLIVRRPSTRRMALGDIIQVEED
ncbi:uncharacterized protein LOC120397337 [Mauremys reevesii]|uniref:uncharacterized protein LOC120397337 n=1 Tax=Mauremys reevesii TaxID=260615 RepID=UPI00193ED494|nr:uncharacterized protein LOC120397337 [Mauremys reevesii]